MCNVQLFLQSTIINQFHEKINPFFESGAWQVENWKWKMENWEWSYFFQQTSWQAYIPCYIIKSQQSMLFFTFPIGNWYTSIVAKLIFIAFSALYLPHWKLIQSQTALNILPIIFALPFPSGIDTKKPLLQLMCRLFSLPFPLGTLQLAISNEMLTAVTFSFISSFEQSACNVQKISRYK